MGFQNACQLHFMLEHSHNHCCKMVLMGVWIQNAAEMYAFLNPFDTHLSIDREMCVEWVFGFGSDMGLHDKAA